jgi:hypothetical protein
MRYKRLLYWSVPLSTHSLFDVMHTRVAQIIFPILLLGTCLLTTGCLKTRITTDLPPSSKTVELEWAHGFVYGLVPPINAPLDVSEQCASGIAEVYFRQPFVQVLAQGLTGSLYSPQAFTVTCASEPSAFSAPSPPPSPLSEGALHSPRRPQ